MLVGVAVDHLDVVGESALVHGHYGKGHVLRRDAPPKLSDPIELGGSDPSRHPAAQIVDLGSGSEV